MIEAAREYSRKPQTRWADPLHDEDSIARRRRC
jgi:hypothetical protein